MMNAESGGAQRRPVFAFDSAFCSHHSAFDPMPSAARDIVVSNKLGLHARPAMQFVDVANQFTSAVLVKKGGEEPAEADGKSVMQMIILAATEGTPLRIEAEGDDAEAAVDKLVELFESKFGEED
jgi:phosphocarrier protein HPr